MTRGRSQVDVVVVGAGAAGLAAAATARSLGLEVLALEAMDRIGGRAFTENVLGFPWDAGCHWLHSGSLNPFARFADAEGFAYRTAPVAWHTWRDEGICGETEETAIDAYLEGVMHEASRRGSEGVDTPIAGLVRGDDPWRDVLKLLVNAEWGCDPAFVSTLDVARYRDTSENWPVEQGYGALVARVAAGVPVELATPVSAISWGGPRPRVTTTRGTIEANAVIVTASTGVLAGDAIAFDPPLPLWKQEAIAAVPLGKANKVALRLGEPALGDMPEQNAAVPIGGGEMISLRLRPFGRPLVDGYIAGPICAELEAAGETAMIETATEALAKLLGNGIRGQIEGAHVSRWGREAYIRGAYTAAIPGQAHRRGDLALPLDDKLFFAGEATSPRFFTTCHGAWESGVTAAQAAAAALRRAPLRHDVLARDAKRHIPEETGTTVPGDSFSRSGKWAPAGACARKPA